MKIPLKKLDEININDYPNVKYILKTYFKDYTKDDKKSISLLFDDDFIQRLFNNIDLSIKYKNNKFIKRITLEKPIKKSYIIKDNVNIISVINDYTMAYYVDAKTILRNIDDIERLICNNHYYKTYKTNANALLDLFYSNEFYKKIKLGKVFNLIFDKIKSDDIGTIYNCLQGLMSVDDSIGDSIKIVKGSIINDYYNHNNYSDNGGGELWRSCMKNIRMYGRFDIYAKNPEVVSLAILFDEEKKDSKKISARCIIWNDKYFDRIYFCKQKDFNILYSYLINKNYFNVYGGNGPISGNMPNSIKLKEWAFKSYPYLDTYKNLDISSGILYRTHKDLPKNLNLHTLTSPNIGSINYSGNNTNNIEPILTSRRRRLMNAIKLDNKKLLHIFSKDESKYIPIINSIYDKKLKSYVSLSENKCYNIFSKSFNYFGNNLDDGTDRLIPVRISILSLLEIIHDNYSDVLKRTNFTDFELMIILSKLSYLPFDTSMMERIGRGELDIPNTNTGDAQLKICLPKNKIVKIGNHSWDSYYLYHGDAILNDDCTYREDVSKKSLGKLSNQEMYNKIVSAKSNIASLLSKNMKYDQNKYMNSIKYFYYMLNE